MCFTLRKMTFLVLNQLNVLFCLVSKGNMRCFRYNRKTANVDTDPDPDRAFQFDTDPDPNI